MNHRRAYTPLNVDEPSDSGYYPRELEEDTAGVWKAVCLAVFLLVLGVTFFVFSLLHATGHFIDADGAGWGFLILGLLTFIPGFYHSRIAYYAWRGYSGYSLKSIPSL